MVSITNAEVGSIVYNLIDNIPTGISGTLSMLATQAINSANNFTGESVSPSAITDAFQPAIIHLTIANTLKLMESQGLGTKSVKIGELSITKGMKEGTSSDFENLGYRELNQIGQHISYYQCWS